MPTQGACWKNGPESYVCMYGECKQTVCERMHACRLPSIAALNTEFPLNTATIPTEGAGLHPQRVLTAWPQILISLTATENLSSIQIRAGRSHINPIPN